MRHVIDMILHMEKYINIIVQNYGSETYLILFLIIFCETGLVVTPFLPGESLVIAASAFSANGSLNIWILFVVFWLAAVLGDISNYSIGRKLGHKVKKFIKEEHMEKATTFYKEKGRLTILACRFLPIIRTVGPFVAGISKMNFLEFFICNLVGCTLWASIFTFGGFFFGNIPIVRENSSLIVALVVAISILPTIITYVRMKIGKIQK